jgi:hypothetical protein
LQGRDRCSSAPRVNSPLGDVEDEIWTDFVLWGTGCRKPKAKSLPVRSLFMKSSQRCFCAIDQFSMRDSCPRGFLPIIKTVSPNRLGTHFRQAASAASKLANRSGSRLRWRPQCGRIQNAAGGGLRLRSRLATAGPHREAFASGELTTCAAAADDALAPEPDVRPSLG